MIAGCGGECKEDVDCDDDNGCTKDSCVKKECKSKKIPDCTCGNNQCEEAKGETECSCVEDCGKCDGKVGEYLQKSCDDEDQCVVDVISQKPVVETGMIDDQERRETQAKIITTYTYDEPFNLDKSLFNIKFQLDTKLPEIRNLKINKVQVIAVSGRMVRSEYPESKLIGEVKDVNRILWDGYTDVETNIIMDTSAEEAEEKKIIVKTYYSYDTVDSRGNPTTLSRAETSDEMNIILVDPTKEQKCPPVTEWDDGNDCTTDSCTPATNYFVIHKIKSESCEGNYVCESGENRCTVPQDCGSCTGQVGEYIRLNCVNDKCMSEFINPDVIEQMKTVDELSLPSSSTEDIKFAVTLMHDEPFDMATSNIILKLEVLQKADATSNFKITRMQLLEGDHELGITDMSQGFTSIGEAHDLAIGTDFSLPSLHDSKETVLKVYYGYDGVDRRGDPVSYANEVFEITMPDITFVNAGAEV
ncbi:hypothetical protein ACFLYT_01170 [Nanoarchaeota archaeon]